MLLLKHILIIKKKLLKKQKNSRNWKKKKSSQIKCSDFFFKSQISWIINNSWYSFLHNLLGFKRNSDIEFIKALIQFNYNLINKALHFSKRCSYRNAYELILASTETFNKSKEILQKYYNDSVQNYFNFVNKIEKSYYNH